MKTKFYLFAIFSLFQFTLSAQIYIDDEISVEQMVMDFFDGECVTISNITFTGAPESAAYFEGAGTDVNIPAGIFLGSGSALNAVGPNDSGAISTAFGTDGDADLSAEVSGATWDAAILEMDIVSSEAELYFYYVFGSEEYPEYVNSGFNDVFAFYVSGPGISGQHNIAMVPNQDTAVTINTINDGYNSQYYVDNTGGQDVQFDGFTTELPAPFVVIPNETYHIKIAIADVSDQIFDSGVFLGVESLCGDSLVTPPAIASFSIDGTTVTVENNSRYATSYFWDFDDMTTSSERHPAPHVYAEPGNYTISLITQNYCCSDTLSTELMVGTVGLEETAVKPFRIFPNPVNRDLQIQWDAGTDYRLELFDVAGKMMLTEESSQSQVIDFEQLVQGVYLLKIYTEDDVYTEKIVKEQ